jgi:hypothetical protein
MTCGIAPQGCEQFSRRSDRGRGCYPQADAPASLPVTEAGTLAEGRRRATADFLRHGERKNGKVRTLALVVSLLALASGSCWGGHEGSLNNEQPKPTPPPKLVQASTRLLAKCQRTATKLGYPVPCPTLVPDGLVPTAGIGCRLDIIGRGCGRPWRKWAFGSSETADQHLVITASPRPLQNFAKLVNGPGWYAAARVRPLRSFTLNGWEMRAVYAPPATNDGSAFAHHIVLIWTVDAHTYGVGFHNVHGIRATLDLDLALAHGMRLVVPQKGG